MRRQCLLSLLLLCFPAAAGAQQALPPPPLRYPLPAAAAPAAPLLPAWRWDPAITAVASAVLPGAGQWLQGQRRWVPYLAVEAWSWIRLRERRGEARDLARGYRDLAWGTARRISVGARRDTVFEYYEALSQYHASGALDIAPDVEGVQPEGDASTFNGQLWELSRKLYFGSADYPPGTPPYEAALAYYLAHAIPPAFAWAWGASTLEREVFAGMIRESDEAYRSGTRMLGLILANHIASAVDALISARLNALAEGRAELRTELVPQAGRTRLDAQLRVRF